MFLVNYLNRSDTDKSRPLFECLYAIEIFTIICILLLSYPLAVAVFTTRSYHRNIRLRLVVFIIHAVICSLWRFVLILHQMFGPIEYAEPAYLIMGSLNREAFKGYAITFTLILALDRWIATVCWSWYESQKLSTIIVFIILECAQLFISWALSGTLISEIITDQDITLYYGILLISAVICFSTALRYNRREVKISKRGAQIESYSVSRSYQYNENVAIMEVLNRISGPVAACCIPCFACYGIYSNIPKEAGMDLLRYIAIALYDFWLTMSILTVMLCFLRSEPKFRAAIREFKHIDWIFCKCGMFEHDASVIKVAPQQETNTYFDMLSRDLGSRRNSATVRHQ